MAQHAETFEYWGRVIPIGSTKEQIEEWANNIAYEKKMDSADVEAELLTLQLQASIDRNARRERSHTFVRQTGGQI
jgi:hypothetical protein